MRRNLIVCLMILLSAVAARSGVPMGAEAQYYVSSALEGQSPPVIRCRIAALGTEKIGTSVYQWWEMTLVKRTGGGVLGVRVLSERVPMTSREGIGRIERYIYSPSSGACLEYRDERTGRALLPEIGLAPNLLPQVSPDARYEDGFANSGRLLGHTLVRTWLRDDFPKTAFDNVRVLNLRSDLLIGSQADRVVTGWGKSTPYTKENYSEMIAAGANYFQPAPELHKSVENEPVFWRGPGVWPDDFYRSNYVTHAMFLDEPMVRFGWDKWVPNHLQSPDVMAEALRNRLEAMELPSKGSRKLNTAGLAETGSLEVSVPKPPSWDTDYESAWYQMAGGSPGVIHEGRYQRRGYGYDPESLLGNGLEGLTQRDQFNFFFAFLRGAARAHNGYWGTSVYPEGDPAYRLPALTHAYDSGARMLWFWLDGNLTYKEELKIIKGLMEHVRQHPRPPLSVVMKRADVGIVLPSGCAFSWNGTWGMDREELTDQGASWGDIAAAAFWEGVLCSRRGVEYDYVVDEPGIENLGYKRLIFIRENGRVDGLPSGESRAPKGLRLKLEPSKETPTAERMNLPAEYSIARAGRITVDADLSDWNGADWIELDGPPYHFGDNYETTLTLTVPDWVKPDSDLGYLGFTYATLTPELRKRYLLEGWEDSVVVTSVKPDSPAAVGGLREGDIILQYGDKRTKYGFQVWGKNEDYRKRPGARIPFVIQRNGTDRLNGSKDLSAKAAFKVDDRNLYLAFNVTDDVHSQMMDGWELWQGDSVQVGLDAMLERTPTAYGENDYEIGFALRNGKPIAFRWKGRRGQPTGEMKDVKVAIRREGDKTLYEAAVSLSDLAPLSPDMWPKLGVNIVVNDSDDGNGRKARLEWKTGAMTAGKKPAEFAVCECAPSADETKVSAAILWNRRCMRPGGSAALTIAVRSPKTRAAKITASLRSLDDVKAAPVRAEIPIQVSPEPKEWTLDCATLSPPGRYKLEVAVIAPDGTAAAKDGLPVYVYP